MTWHHAQEERLKESKSTKEDEVGWEGSSDIRTAREYNNQDKCQDESHNP